MLWLFDNHYDIFEVNFSFLKVRASLIIKPFCFEELLKLTEKFSFLFLTGSIESKAWSGLSLMFCDAYSIPKKSFVKIRIHYYNVLGSLLLPDLGSLPKTHILCSSCHKVLGSFINHVDIEGGGGLPNIHITTGVLKLAFTPNLLAGEII